jgi:hypothetical protein
LVSLTPVDRKKDGDEQMRIGNRADRAGSIVMIFKDFNKKQKRDTQNISVY